MRAFLLLLIGLAWTGLAYAEDIQPAMPIDRPPPDYPTSAGSAEGYVKLHFGIGADGHVRNPVIVDSNPKATFDQAALDALSRWSYRPRTLDGHAVEQPDNGILLRFKPAPAAPRPKVIYSPPPFYPKKAYDSKIEGSVTLRFDVTETGSTMNVQVAKSTSPLFEDAAIENIETWLFEPVAVDGAPRAVTNVTTTIEFKLPDALLKPVVVSRRNPRYPEEAIRRGLNGSCTIDFWLETDGTVSDPRIAICMPGDLFEKVTLDAIKDWRFEPAMGPNGPIRKLTHYTFSYVLYPGPSNSYLRAGQWVRLRYTLEPDGTAKDISVVEQSEPDLPVERAIDQVKQSRFRPYLENGIPVEKVGLTITVNGREPKR